MGACIDAGLKIRQCLVWKKDALVLGRQDFQWIHEPCLYGEKPDREYRPDNPEYADLPFSLYGWKDGDRHYFYKNRRQVTVLEFDKPKVNDKHPTMKPVMLFNYQMECCSKPGDIVLDLFAGSGTTIIAAEQNKRRAYCMELDPKYIDVIIDRWQQLSGEKAVLLNGES